jgi:hypothetical protein
MKNDEQKNKERPHLEKVKACLERSHLGYTETHNGTSTLMEIRPAEKKEEHKGEDQGHGLKDHG